MKYKVGQRVRIYRNLSNGGIPKETHTIYGWKKQLSSKKYPSGVVYDLGNIGHWSEENLEPVTNRSSIGKKAYQTFLKNGGSRNSKGQFSNTQNIYWEKLGKDLEDTFWDTPDLISEVKMVKALAKVFQKHGLIDKGVEI